MSYINLEIIGYIGQSAIVKQVQNYFIISFSVSSNSSYSTSDGEIIERTEWVSCSVYCNSDKQIEKHIYFVKGQLIMCSGRPTITNYIDKNGITKSAINLNVKSYQFLGKSIYSLNKLSNQDQLTSNNQNTTVEDIVSSNPDIDSVF